MFGVLAMEPQNVAKYYDTHTLSINSAVATNEQLVASVNSSFKAYCTKYKKSLDCTYQINWVTDKFGKPLGFGYLWLSNPEVYYMLLGQNPDGTERMEYQKDPKWQAPEKPLDDALAEVQHTSTSWADWADDDDAIEQQYICPTIKKQLPPLMTLPKFAYTASQKLAVKQLQEAAKEDTLTPEEGCLTDPNNGTFLIKAARVKDVEEKYKHNMLFCGDVPSSVKAEDLKRMFTQYVSDTKAVCVSRTCSNDPKRGDVRKPNKSPIYESYPIVSINDNHGTGRRMAFITFDHHTKDAQFALLMTKRTIYPLDRNRSAIMYFSHCYMKEQ